MHILAIETSCDETALARVTLDKEQRQVILHEQILYSQVSDHESYGGVVPGLARRLHNKKLPQMLIDMLQQLETPLDAIAVTSGPGLEPSLYVGYNQASVLATTLSIPLITVNHMHGHMFSSFLDSDQAYIPQGAEYPFLAMTISGGHTEFIYVHDYRTYEYKGYTIDDAVGEAFDKVAKMLDLGYPGGPRISELAEEGDPQAIDFPRPMSSSGDGRMSFSGLKTAVMYYVQSFENLSHQQICDIAASFQQAIIDTLLRKLDIITKDLEVNAIRTGGGVMANQQLRYALSQWSREHNIPVHIPDMSYTTDNAVMIGYVAALDCYHDTVKTLPVSGRLSSLE
jgi:N6-L-threonylcarbamoyladenine synthase